MEKQLGLHTFTPKVLLRSRRLARNQPASPCFVNLNLTPSKTMKKVLGSPQVVFKVTEFPAC